MSRIETNPYTPPTNGDTEQADWYLASGCRYLKSIGYFMIVYLICVIPFSVYQVRESPTWDAEVIGMMTMLVAMLLFFGAMIHAANRLPDDFQGLYRRARWLGILAGAFGFPVLTIPAFIGVSRLSKYRTLVETESNLPLAVGAGGTDVETGKKF